jgi:lipopolysaccharide transport system permease protein
MSTTPTAPAAALETVNREDPHFKAVVEPPTGWSFPSFRELWAYRDLIYFLGRRDVAARYKQTAIGALWALIQPMGLAAAFTVFLGILAGRPEFNGVPYPVFALAGMTIWLFLSTAVARGAGSTTDNTELIKNVFFPRLILPLAAVVSPLVDFVVAFAVLIVFMLFFGIVPAPTVVLVPLILALAFVTALAIGLWLSALAVKWRDVQHLVPFATLILLFISPVMYPLSEVPEAVRPIYAINPLTGVLEGFRWCLIPGTDPPGLLLLIPVFTSAVLLVSGLLYFHHREREFADDI